MPMKEILTIDRINSLIRIPLKWINENYPPSDKVKILREIDTDRIIITPIGEQTNEPSRTSKSNNKTK